MWVTAAPRPLIKVITQMRSCEGPGPRLPFPTGAVDRAAAGRTLTMNQGAWSPSLMLCLTLAGVASGFETWNSRPNVVLLVADDLGLGDLGCYGNGSVSTPNIDRLAREGVMLTQYLAAASVCTPSRAAFLTGRYPIRSGMASPNNLFRDIMWLGASGGLPGNETTFARTLQQRGYRTGLIGKWHLGLSCAWRGDHCAHPLTHGFDEFVGLPLGLQSDCAGSEVTHAGQEMHYQLRVWLWVASAAVAALPVLLTVLRLAGWLPVPAWLIATSALLAAVFFLSWFSSYGFVRRWNCVIMRGHEVVQQPADATRAPSIMLREALGFIERHRRQPFLLLLSFLHVHPALRARPFRGRSQCKARSDLVEELDRMVGKVLEALDREQLTHNTVVHFTSDNSARLELWEGSWNDVFQGGSGAGGWEDSVRVPGIFRWPAALGAGLVVDEPVSLMDVFPTLSHVAGAALPRDRVIDGRNLLPLLQGRVRHSAHDFLFHYCGVSLHAVRWAQPDCGTVWKAHFVTPDPEGCPASGPWCPCSGSEVTVHDPPLLFDLSRDPAESCPLDPDREPLYGSVLAKMAAAVREHRASLRPAPLQLTALRALWRPWLQPCCGAFPLCGCAGDDL